MDILKKRFARGEIEREEFEERKKLLKRRYRNGEFSKDEYERRIGNTLH